MLAPSEPRRDTGAAPTPKHVAILGLGPSLEAYVDLVKRMGGRSAFCDEVWSINALGDVIQCDRIFHMDDVRVQEVRAAAEPDSNIARMLAWMRRHPGPIYTSRSHPDYPGLVDYPLADVLNDTVKVAYFNSTAAYAVAFAIYLGVEKISLFGMDFTYPNAHQAEKGRACVEFYLGIAKAKGIEIGLPATTTLMDGIATRADRIYGYDTVDLDLSLDERGDVNVAKSFHEQLPSAADIEARYDHAQHPNVLVTKGALA